MQKVYLSSLLCSFLSFAILSISCQKTDTEDSDELVGGLLEVIDHKNYFEDDYPQFFTNVSLRSDGLYYKPNSNEPVLTGFVHAVKVKGYTTYTARGELVNGKQNGLWMAFFDDLRSDWAEIINYKDGKKHGEHKIWWEREVSEYSPGEDFPNLAPWNTTRAEIKNYKEGILDGKYIEHPVYIGNYYKEGSYSEGKKHGEWIMKFPNSEQLANRKTYNKGQLVKEEYWDENGESRAPPN